MIRHFKLTVLLQCANMRQWNAVYDLESVSLQSEHHINATILARSVLEKAAIIPPGPTNSTAASELCSHRYVDAYASWVHAPCDWWLHDSMGDQGFWLWQSQQHSHRGLSTWNCKIGLVLLVPMAFQHCVLRWSGCAGCGGTCWCIAPWLVRVRRDCSQGYLIRNTQYVIRNT